MPDIYRGMDQEELNRQYNARATVADFDAEMARYRALSDKCFSNLKATKDIAYGPGFDERLDFFPALEANAPLLIFIHGGYWRALGREDSAFMAGTFVRNGVSVAVLEYTLSPKATMDQIVQQVRTAVSFLFDNALSFGVNPRRISICGSSAGAHLAAMALASDKESQADQRICSAILASGLYDLEPVRLSEPNAWLKLDQEAAYRNSPVHMTLPTDVSFLVVWGGTETDEFKRQSRDFANKALVAGLKAQAFEISDRNHFNIITDLADESRELFRVSLDLIRNTDLDGNLTSKGQEK